MPALGSSPTPAYAVFAAAASQPPGPPPKTPMIAGSVCGTVMGVAWIIGFTIYFRKRYKRKKRHQQVAAGKAVEVEKPPKVPEEKIIIPPDPAILLGCKLPGENTFRDEKQEPIPEATQLEKITESVDPDPPVDDIPTTPMDIGISIEEA